MGVFRHPSPLLLLVFFIAASPSLGETGLRDPYGTRIAPFFREHCVRCHGEDGNVKGKVDLLSIDTGRHLAQRPDLIRDLIDSIDYQEMPPEDEPAPEDSEREEMVALLRAALDESLASRSEAPRTPIRRMTRFQYHSAVKDLFGLTVEVFSLPERMCREYDDYFQPATGRMPDKVKVGSRPLGKSQLIEKRLGGVAAFPQDLRAEHGFDTRADHLTLSPLLMESFLRLGKSIVESHDFHPGTVREWDTYFAAPENDESLDEIARRRLDDLLTRAFRRPVEDAILDRYTNHVLSLVADGRSTFTEAMKEAAAAALASPRFLYLYDGTANEPGEDPVDDFVLASRLSFFLWGSIPDRELLAVAEKGELREPLTLSRQVDRMLRDDRLKRFCDSFPAQWLQLERIVTSEPDREAFPSFYFAKYRTSMDMMLEPLLLFETILVENRPVIELIDSDFTYRSERLRSWYGQEAEGKLGGPVTLQFRRLPVTDPREGGVITTAAVMTMTSGPLRTHPITRGAWVATAIFNDPPEPPPADVPPLEEPDHAEENLTLRERFAAHRERADCAGCHEQIDPLGFALEHYGPAGQWREVYENGRQIDASGTLFRTHTFTDAASFKQAILAEKDRFVRGFAAHLLSYALGREVEAADSPSLDTIVDATSSGEYRFHSLIHALTQCEAFLRTRSTNPTPDHR